jgi:hypothetical protein
VGNTPFSFMPVAASRTRIEPGEYQATCTAVRSPERYRAYNRWYIRVDFAIHETGEVVSRYLNLGTGEHANLQLSTRSEYYKLWTAAAGRKPEKNEPMDPAQIVGVEFLVTVADKEHRTDGVYSRVESVRKEVVAAVATEALCSVTTGLQDYRTTNATVLHHSEATDAIGATTSQALQLPLGGPLEAEIITTGRVTDSIGSGATTAQVLQLPAPGSAAPLPHKESIAAAAGCTVDHLLNAPLEDLTAVQKHAKLKLIQGRGEHAA